MVEGVAFIPRGRALELPCADGGGTVGSCSCCEAAGICAAGICVKEQSALSADSSDTLRAALRTPSISRARPLWEK